MSEKILALQRGDLVAEDGLERRVGELHRHAVGGLAGDEAVDLFAAFERAGVGIEAGLNVGVRVENAREQFLRRMLDDRHQIGSDVFAIVTALVADRAGAEVNFAAFGGVAFR